MARKKVVVIGGGFAGIQFVRNLDAKYYDVLLIDRINHHQFQPLFYQVASAQLEPSSISFPLRKIFHERKNTKIRLAEVQKILPDEKRVLTNIGAFDYDLLVLANGCRTNFFGNDQIAKNSLGLKTTYQAIKIRNIILENFERIASVTEEEKEGLLNFVIVGAGPTGVELAGAFAEKKKYILPKDFPDIDFENFNIILIGGAPLPLAHMSEMAQKNSKKYLEELGVKLILSTYVENYDGKVLSLQNGEKIKTANVIWAAGVTGNIVDGVPEDLIVQNGRIAVDRYNKVNGLEDIYAIGDIAYMETDKYPKGHPQVANVAINQAKNLARNLNRIISNRSQKRYEYKDLGSMATIGKHKAVVDLPFIRFKGYLAWFVWMFLHLMLILNVRNKLIIFINWLFSYFTQDTSLRLILRQSKKSERY